MHTNCKPFYAPQEFSWFILVGVYIPPQACVTEALQHLADQINNVEKKYPDSLLSVLGDFNRANLSYELPKYKQHIKCSTRDTNTLDHCYTGWRKPEYLVSKPMHSRGEHVNSTRKIPSWESNLEPSCCEVMMLTTTPPCSPNRVSKPDGL